MAIKGIGKYLLLERTKCVCVCVCFNCYYLFHRNVRGLMNSFPTCKQNSKPIELNKLLSFLLSPQNPNKNKFESKEEEGRGTSPEVGVWIGEG